MESRWIYGVHVESMWNLWGSVKYSKCPTMSPLRIILGCGEVLDMGIQGSEADINTLGTMKASSLAEANNFFSTSQVLSSSKCPSTQILQHSLGWRR